MPPSIVLEILRITESEMDTRTLTRATEQSRKTKRREEFDREVEPILTTQVDLLKRTEAVREKIIDLPDGEANFGQEIEALGAAADAMAEAEDALAKFDTGPVAVAAESEAIEHLLRARRVGSGGGGGGSNPGAGGPRAGSTNASALALAGRGDAPLARPDQKKVDSGAGKEVDDVPEEMRSAMDRFFNALDK